MEDALPTYSGGLGVLAGDHLRAAADLGLPLVAVTLLYHGGYFEQQIDGAGVQHELAVEWSPAAILTPHPERVAVELNGRRVEVGAWSRVIPGAGGRPGAGLLPRHQAAGQPSRGPADLRPALRRGVGATPTPRGGPGPGRSGHAGRAGPPRHRGPAHERGALVAAGVGRGRPGGVGRNGRHRERPPSPLVCSPPTPRCPPGTTGSTRRWCAGCSAPRPCPHWPRPGPCTGRAQHERARRRRRRTT